MPVDGNIGCSGIEVRSFDHADLAPILKLWMDIRANIAPCLATVRREVKESSVTANPYHTSPYWRRRDGINHAVAARLGVLGRRGPFAVCVGIRAGEVGADLCPCVALVGALEQILRSKIESVRILRREDQGRCPGGAVLCSRGIAAETAHGGRRDRKSVGE